MIHPYFFDLYHGDRLREFDPGTDFLLGAESFVTWRHVDQFTPGGYLPFGAVRVRHEHEPPQPAWVISLKGEFAYANDKLPDGMSKWFYRQVAGKLVMYHEGSRYRGVLHNLQHPTNRAELADFMARHGFADYGFRGPSHSQPIHVAELKAQFIADFLKIQSAV